MELEGIVAVTIVAALVVIVAVGVWPNTSDCK